MGLFDFPRIHFTGNIDVNVPTINNAYYFPLTIYDTTRARPFLPPRLYFSTYKIAKGIHATIHPEIHEDDLNNYVYIEIEPINTIEILREWCMTPLGSFDKDKDYTPYYCAADKDLAPCQSVSIMGNCPGYWNMYGDMGVKLSGVHVTGVQTLDRNKINTWTGSSSKIPADIKPFLSASFDLDTSPGSGITTATMVETISSQSVYANVFCSNVNLYNSDNADEVYLQGTPFRFSALIYSAWRVLNWFPPMAGSARFCSSIPLEKIPNANESRLVQFFRSNNTYDGRPLKGVFVTFTIFEVFENRFDQEYYKNNGQASNPAQCTTVGSITPWYEGDMRSGVLGRHLISLGMESIYENTTLPGSKIPVPFTPSIASLKELEDGRAIFSVDMGNSWPESINPPYSASFKPAHRGEASFETFDLGALVFRHNNDEDSEIARIDINSASNPRGRVFESGCIFDFFIEDPLLIEAIKDNYISGYLVSETSDKHVLQESKYMIATDQKGLYANEGDLPIDGYYVYDENREPCRLRIFERGVPVKKPVKICVAEYSVPEAANDPGGKPNAEIPQMIVDNGVVELASNSLQLRDNAIFYFVYEGQYPDGIPAYALHGGYTIMDTGSFACLRVHPTKNYNKYINPMDPDYIPPRFDIVYKEVFKLYDVVYPAMAKVHPFTAEVWDNGTMSGLVVQRTDRSLWNNILYMPKSRELSNAQHELLKAWAEYIDKREEEEKVDIDKVINGLVKSAFTVELRPIDKIAHFPYVQSCAWAVKGNKLLLIGGRIEGFHGLNEDEIIFDTSKANQSVWVLNLSDFTSRELKLNKAEPNLLQLSSSNMQFCLENDTLYIAGGFGRRNISDEESNYTFDQIMAINIAEMIHQVEINGDPLKAVEDRAISPIVQVTGGEMVKENGIFYLMFGQKYSQSYKVGITGEYTNAIRSFRFENGKVTYINTVVNPDILHRRDLTVAPVTQQNGRFYTAFGGVFTKDNNGFTNPVNIHPIAGSCDIREGTMVQLTNQYNCAYVSIYDHSSDQSTTVLLGGIGRYQYIEERKSWEDGDNGAKLPFVKTITHMIFKNGEMNQAIQIPPEQPALPEFIGANAIFIPNSDLLYSDRIIDYSKILPGISSIGIMYGGIKSIRPTSSSIYPTTFSSTIYEVFIHKTSK